VLTLAEDGRTLVAQTTFTSRFLAQPVSFELRYERVATARPVDRATHRRDRRARRVRPQRRRPPPIRSTGITPVRLSPYATTPEPTPPPRPAEPNATAPASPAASAPATPALEEADGAPGP
jgi:hypothetical protein